MAVRGRLLAPQYRGPRAGAGVVTGGTAGSATYVNGTGQSITVDGMDKVDTFIANIDGGYVASGAISGNVVTVTIYYGDYSEASDGALVEVPNGDYSSQTISWIAIGK